MIPKHGGDVKSATRHTRRRHEQRMKAQAERIANEQKMAEEAARALLQAETDEPEAKIARNGNGEAQVVVVQQIAHEIREFNKKWLKTRTDQEQRDGLVFGPVQWLSVKTGIGERKIARITAEDVKTVGYSDAERILQAIDKEYLLSNGEIHVIPNPNWSLDKWVEYMKEQGCI